MSSKNDTKPNWEVCPSCGAFHRIDHESEKNQACEFCRRKGQTEWTVAMAKVSTRKFWR